MRIGFRAFDGAAPFGREPAQLGRVFERLARLFGLRQYPRAPFAIDRFERRQIGIAGAPLQIGAGDRIQPDDMSGKPLGKSGGEVDPPARVRARIEYHQQILVAHHRPPASDLPVAGIMRPRRPW